MSKKAVKWHKQPKDKRGPPSSAAGQDLAARWLSVEEGDPERGELHQEMIELMRWEIESGGLKQMGLLWSAAAEGCVPMMEAIWAAPESSREKSTAMRALGEAVRAGKTEAAIWLIERGALEREKETWLAGLEMLIRGEMSPEQWARVRARHGKLEIRQATEFGRGLAKLARGGRERDLSWALEWLEEASAPMRLMALSGAMALVEGPLISRLKERAMALAESMELGEAARIGASKALRSGI